MENWMDLVVLGDQLEMIGLLAPCLNDSKGSILLVTDLLHRVQVVNILGSQHDFISNFESFGGVVFIILSFLGFKSLVKMRVYKRTSRLTPLRGRHPLRVNESSNSMNTESY